MKTQEFKKGQLVKCPKGNYHISYFLEPSNSFDSLGNRIKHVREYYQEGFEIMIKGAGLYTADQISIIEEKPIYQQIIDTVNGEEEFCKLAGMERPQVDFEMLNRTFDTQLEVLKIMDGTKWNELKEYENFKLFVDLLSKSSTFAHKAHKELKKLNTY